MKMLRKLLCVALIVAMIAVTAMVAAAEGTGTAADAGTDAVSAATRTLYLDSKDFIAPVYDYFSIDGLQKSDKVTSVKSSDKQVLKVVSLQKGTRSTRNYEDKTTKNTYSTQIYVRLLKAGTATLNYKLNGEERAQTYTVRKYVNPIKSLVISGIDNTNLKTLFARNCYDGIKLAKTAQAGRMTIKAANGWRIRYAYWEDNTKNIERQFTAGGKGVSACYIELPKMSRKGSYYVGVSLVNLATKGEKLIGLSIN